MEAGEEERVDQGEELTGGRRGQALGGGLRGRFCEAKEAEREVRFSDKGAGAPA